MDAKRREVVPDDLKGETMGGTCGGIAGVAVAPSGGSGGAATDARLTVRRPGLARMISISLPTLDRWAAAGKLPRPVKIGGVVMWPVAEIEAWLNTRGPGGELLDQGQWAKVRADVLRRS